MSKINKPSQKKMHSARRRVMKALNIPLPNEPKLPIMTDNTGLGAKKDEADRINAEMIQLRNLANTRQEWDALLMKACAAIATNAWRAKTKMVDADTGEPKEEMKRVYRHVDAIIESLKQIGIETVDPVGRAYDSGLALHVVSFEPTQGISHEEIKETIKPSVAWQGQLIQIGEVIVGTPQKG